MPDPRAHHRSKPLTVNENLKPSLAEVCLVLSKIKKWNNSILAYFYSALNIGHCLRTALQKYIKTKALGKTQDVQEGHCLSADQEMA